MAGAWLALVAAMFVTATASAYDTKVQVTGHALPSELQGVGVEEHLGAQLDLGNTFVDEAGATVSLKSFFTGEKPVLLAMVYYTCPSLCNYHLNGLTETMKQLKWTAGKDFEVVAVSMNASETSDVAGKKKTNYLQVYGRPEGDKGWHFLVGNEGNVRALAQQLGFKFQWIEDKKQFAHASVAYVLTPEGKISRYLHGIAVEPQTMRLSLLEASNGKVGSILEQAMMVCFAFDPTKGKYTIYAWNIMRIGAALMVLLLAVIFLPIWWRDRHQQGPRI